MALGEGRELALEERVDAVWIDAGRAGHGRQSDGGRSAVGPRSTRVVQAKAAGEDPSERTGRCVSEDGARQRRHGPIRDDRSVEVAWCSRRPGRWRGRARDAARGSSCSRWCGSTASWWSSTVGACAESRRIVRRRTNGRYAKACGSSIPSGRALGRDGPWAAVPVARRGLGDRAMYVPAGRGSESYRFLDSVDAQTCCPASAFNLTPSRMRCKSPGVSNPVPARRRRTGPESARRDPPKVTPRARGFTSHNRDPQARICRRNCRG